MQLSVLRIMFPSRPFQLSWCMELWFLSFTLFSASHFTDHRFQRMSLLLMLEAMSPFSDLLALGVCLFLFFINLFIYLFIFGCVGSSLLCTGFLQLRRAGVTIPCSVRASHCNGFSCCRARAPGMRASVVVACGLSSCGLQALERRLSSCCTRAQLLRGMWDLPGPGLEPVSPALAGGFLTTAPPGKPCLFVFGTRFCLQDLESCVNLLACSEYLLSHLKMSYQYLDNCFCLSTCHHLRPLVSESLLLEKPAKTHTLTDVFKRMVLLGFLMLLAKIGAMSSLWFSPQDSVATELSKEY